MKKENNSIKKEGNYYAKVLFTALVIILLLCVIISIGYIGFQYVISETRTEVNNYVNNPPFTCEIRFKDMYFKGPCTDDIIEGMEGMANAYVKLEILPLCMSSPYSYRYSLCKEMEARS